MKILRTLGILAIVAALVIGGAGSAFAKNPHGESQGGGNNAHGKSGLFGTAESAVDDVVTLRTKDGSTVQVTLTDTAKYKAPGETKGWIIGFETFVDTLLDGNIENIEGRRIAALVNFTDGDTADALRLMLIKITPPLHAHRVGIVTEFPLDESGNGSIEIIDNHGVSHTFLITEGTVYRPSAEDGGISELSGEELEEALIGGCVTIVTTGDPKSEPPAKAVVLHDELPDWAGGKIIVIKEIAGSEESELSFEFTADYYDSFFYLSAEDGKDNSGWLEAGEYTVAELLEELPDDWDLTDIEIEDPSEDSSRDLDEGEAYINLAARETVTVTFTNTFTEPT